jgi:autotransporter passenger strand-loop-strand repeat protein
VVLPSGSIALVAFGGTARATTISTGARQFVLGRASGTKVSNPELPPTTLIRKFSEFYGNACVPANILMRGDHSI